MRVYAVYDPGKLKQLVDNVESDWDPQVRTVAAIWLLCILWLNDCSNTELGTSCKIMLKSRKQLPRPYAHILSKTEHLNVQVGVKHRQIISRLQVVEDFLFDHDRYNALAQYLARRGHAVKALSMWKRCAARMEGGKSFARDLLTNVWSRNRGALFLCTGASVV